VKVKGALGRLVRRTRRPDGTPLSPQDAARKRRRLAVIPSLFTLANGICGFAAIVQLASVQFDPATRAVLNPSHFTNAAWLILLGMVFDVFDGRIARMTATTGDFGGELDSLCDAITFGVAPGLAVVMMNAKAVTNPFFANVAWVFGLAFACGAILRLARFNVENDHDESAHQSFKGLPSPAAAGTIATLLLFQGFLRSDRALVQMLPGATLARAADAIGAALPFVALTLGWLMVSEVRYVHLANRHLRGKRSGRHIARLAFGAILLALLPEMTMALGFVGFVASGLVLGLVRRLSGPEPVPVAAPAPAPATAAAIVAAAAPPIVVTAGESVATPALVITSPAPVEAAPRTESR